VKAAHTDGNGSRPRRLPQPAKERWQPLRSGFLNIYKYDREEFHYENGRLLLRGNNGTGKSRVLALQLPFLLEGDTSPHRVEPDGDQAKRIEWNLLMGSYPERTGYTWIEFGRRAPEGTHQYLSLGCGMTAVEGRTGVQRWFFITNQRIGVDLTLENEFKQVIGRERLQEAIGSCGQVFTKAHEYRQAVDHNLFRLGEFRFTTLLNLLVRLRRPQLTRQFDENELSEILSEALPPVSSSILADVSEAFRTLEADQVQLASFVAANAAVANFLKDYIRYIQVAARRRAGLVRDRQNSYENRLRVIRAEEARERETLGKIEEAARELLRLESEATTVQTEIDTLLSSPRMKDAEDLARADKDVKARTEEKESAAKSLQQLVFRRNEARQRLKLTNEILDASRNDLAAAAVKTFESARSALIQTDFEASISPLSLPDLPDSSAIRDAQRSAENAAAQQIRRIHTLRQLNELLFKADERLRTAVQEEDRIQAELDRTMAAHRDQHDELRRATRALVDAYRQWANSLNELQTGDLESALAALTLWCETLENGNPAQEWVRSCEQKAIRGIADMRAQLEQELAKANRLLEDLEQERGRLESGRHVPPPAPYTRDVDSRANRPGAPLWLVCDFNDDVDAPTRAGFEAALESAGLLDAWITPDGKLLDRTVQDTILTIGSSPLPDDDAHLGCFLRSSINAEDEHATTVTAGIVAQVLRHIGAGRDSGFIWVAPTGEWRMGPLNGAWMKTDAEHIGHSAREVGRKRRLEQLKLEIAKLNDTIRNLKSRLDALAERDRKLRNEIDSIPPDNSIRKLHAQIAATVTAVENLRRRLAEAQERTANCRQQRRAVAENRDQTARDLGMTEWANQLDVVEKAVWDYRVAVEQLFGGIKLHLARREQATNAANEFESAREAEQQESVRYRQSELLLTAATSERDTLQRTVGAAVEEITRELANARGRQSAIRELEKLASEGRSNAQTELARVREALRIHNEELATESRLRDEAVHQFKSFAETRLLHLAAPLADDAARSWSITRAVEAARETVAALANVDAGDDAWERLQNGILRQYSDLLQQLLSHDCRQSGTWCGDVFVATTSLGSQERTIEELRDWLSYEVTTRQELLAAREREILENHLTGEVADHLNALLHRGEELVQSMNEELESRPTSTGMKLRFVWRVREDEPGLADARRLLMRMSGAWTPTERELVGGFLQSRIQAERNATEAPSWHESLALALDYRRWHMFGVERHQDGRWKLLTRRTHGTGSGGEKAIALTLPQFAAAAAYYRSADPLAPRLILLDEAFVGIDTDMRGKCMGFIEAFDLDFIMTSEREWACYSTLPGVAIYQLSTRLGLDAVGLTRWVWNGEERLMDAP